jgi:hypothetical protein
LEEADEHFTRLKEWGLTFLRFLVTWEAIEHAGPGLYDEEYLDYVYEVVKKAGEYGFMLFIDPHQDVWSRFSGGDGAPGWTFEVVGLDITKFDETGAAITHQGHGDPFPRMIWPTNSQKLAAATMFTLFFGGDDFAPNLKVEGETVQGYLQRHYVAAIREVADRLKEFPFVIGYDTLNEPTPGYIGWKDLNQPGGYFNLGPSPSPFQSVLLGAGIPQEVDFYKPWVAGGRKAGKRLINPDGERAWLDGVECIWRIHGLWEIDKDGHPELLRPGYFSKVNGKVVDFTQDYMQPFFNRFAEAIRSVDSDAMIFIEAEFGTKPPMWGTDDAHNIVWAPHWYDGLTLQLKRYSPFIAANAFERRVVLGRRKIEKSFSEQAGDLLEWASERLGEVPTVIGEFGIPFDMQKKKAYRTGDFRSQINAMDRSFKAIEANLVNCTLWNYTADNTNARGDMWNDEDLSIFSRDQQTDPVNVYSGGRALEAVVRPYAMRVAGKPLRMSFDLKSREFEFEFKHDSAISESTEIFVPNFQYPEGYEVEVSDGKYEINQALQRMYFLPGISTDRHRIQILPRRTS